MKVVIYTVLSALGALGLAYVVGPALRATWEAFMAFVGTPVGVITMGVVMLVLTVLMIVELRRHYRV